MFQPLFNYANFTALQSLMLKEVCGKVCFSHSGIILICDLHEVHH